MAKTISTAADGDNRVTYTFRVLVEPDENAWHAYCPALQGYRAATWGASREEALRHIHEVVGMVGAELVEDGEDLPADVDVSGAQLGPGVIRSGVPC
jgi:predicted RNase H-like HicB family nuclease